MEKQGVNNITEHRTPADITVFAAQHCPSGPFNDTERDVDPNVCVVWFNEGGSVRGDIAKSTNLTIPLGHRCELVLFPGSDCDSTTAFPPLAPGMCREQQGEFPFFGSYVWRCDPMRE
jgi:hypothetical protein